VVTRRGRWKTVCARGAYPALPGGRSPSPLDVMKTHQTVWTLVAASMIAAGVGSAVPAQTPPEVFDDQHAPIGVKHFGPIVHTKAQCLNLGGSWKVIGQSLKPRCTVPTTDGGMVCTDHSQCQGLCIGPQDAKPGTRTTGRCRASYSLIATCLVYVSKGIAEPGLCVE
jgi:hypothetical protein